MFSSVELFLNETKITTPSNHYGYRAYITNLLNYNKEGKFTKLINEGFCLSFDDWEYKNEFLKSKMHEISLYERLQTDLLFQPKLLPPGVNVRLKLHRAPAGSDVINYDDPNNAGKELCMNILSASLHVRRVKLYPHKMLTIENELSKTNAVIPIKRVDVKSLACIAGMARYQFDNFVNGQLPVRLILGVVKHSSALGNSKENPFEFKIHDMTEVCLLKNGSADNVPYQIVNASSICKIPKIAHAYTEIFSSSGCSEATGCGVSLKKFCEDSALFCFDLSIDQSPGDGSFVNPTQYGSLGIRLSFEKETAEAYNKILLTEFNNTIEIDKLRNIVLDF